jgi:hypothetical protein
MTTGRSPSSKFSPSESGRPPLPDKLDEILVGFAERYPEYQDFIKLGDKHAVVNLLKEAKQAILANYIPKSHLEPLLEEAINKVFPPGAFVEYSGGQDNFASGYSHAMKGVIALKQEIKEKLGLAPNLLDKGEGA